METKELVKSREENIEMLTNFLTTNADGDNIIGDGTKIVRDERIPMKHLFADQVYIRQMKMEQGRLVIGAIHKHLHIWFLLTGHLSIATKEGVEDYEAPCYVISKPGTQRVLFANKDSIFVNIHKNPTNTEDLDELESEIVALNKEDYEEYVKQEKN